MNTCLIFCASFKPAFLCDVYILSNKLPSTAYISSWCVQPVPFSPQHFPFQMAYSKETLKMNGSTLVQSEQDFLWTNITFTRHSVDFFRLHIAYCYKVYVS